MAILSIQICNVCGTWDDDDDDDPPWIKITPAKLIFAFPGHAWDEFDRNDDVHWGYDQRHSSFASFAQLKSQFIFGSAQTRRRRRGELCPFASRWWPHSRETWGRPNRQRPPFLRRLFASQPSSHIKKLASRWYFLSIVVVCGIIIKSIACRWRLFQAEQATETEIILLFY